jgi:endonuclease YncB( thermonuclease family)
MSLLTDQDNIKMGTICSSTIKEDESAKRVKDESKIPLFSFKANGLRAYCCKVHDGDTIHATLVWPGMSERIKLSIRLYGINTAELSTQRGKEVRKWLSAQILGREIILNLLGSDKYGRTLGEIFIPSTNESSINKQLISGGMAMPYSGEGPKLWN